MSKKDRELVGLQQKIIDAADEEKTIAEKRLRSNMSERRPHQHMTNGLEHSSLMSDEETSHRGRAVLLLSLLLKFSRRK